MYVQWRLKKSQMGDSSCTRRKDGNFEAQSAREGVQKTKLTKYFKIGYV
jgi:hypothetical protein